MTYICDTNFIIRYLTDDQPDMFAQAKDIFDQIEDNKLTAIIEPEIFAEVVFVLFSFYEFSRKKIVEDLGLLFSYKGLIIDKELYTKTLELYDSNSKLSIVDCMLAARILINHDMKLLSFDKALLKLVN